MGIKTYNPYTPSRRNMTGLDFSENAIPMRSHPAKYGEGFDAPPTLERSRSEEHTSELQSH